LFARRPVNQSRLQSYKESSPWSSSHSIRSMVGIDLRAHDKSKSTRLGHVRRWLLSPL
jgi:hypothetical protein